MSLNLAAAAAAAASLALLVLTSTTSANPTTEPPTPAPATELNLCPCVTNSTAPQSSSPSSSSSSSSSSQQHTSTIPNTLIHGMTCMCHAGPHAAAHMRDDYTYSPGIGAHKLHTRAATWNEARKMCNEEGGHLAIVNSLIEAHVLTNIFTKSGPVKGASYLDLAYIGIHDFYKEGEWVTILGESLFKTGYTVWSDKWGGQPDNGGGNQNCGVLLKEGGLDDVNCDVPFAFFCEIPTTYIIH